MGPLVPYLVSEPMNLIIALFLGMGFGFVLEQAGFSSSRRLAGVFYGYDFTVLRVFFTAAVTAMSGVILLNHFGFLDTEAIFINPLWQKPALVGGVIMGIGFILGGYCPGTSVCAAAIGKVDALFFIGGGLLGALLFAEAYPLYQGFYASTSLGPLKVFKSLGISQGLFAFLLIAMAVGAFVVTTRIEKKVAGKAAPSQGFPMLRHMAAGAGVLLLGVVFLFLPDFQTRMLRKVSVPAYQSAHPVAEMDADELAFRILDRDPSLQIVDLRPAPEFTQVALPRSINLTQSGLFSREPGSGLTQRRIRKVVLAATEAEARQACLILQELGYENFSTLKGGFPAFQRLYLEDTPLVAEDGRNAEDVRRFRESARIQIPQLIAAQKAEATQAPRPIKKIQGGC